MGGAVDMGVGTVYAGDKKVEPAKKKEEVKKNELKMSGVLEGEAMSYVEVDMTEWRFSKIWKGQKVLAIAGHGQRVKRGDVLIEFDTRDIDLDILKREREVRKKAFSLDKKALYVRTR